jgi:hypothetical protein
MGVGGEEEEGEGKNSRYLCNSYSDVSQR